MKYERSMFSFMFYRDADMQRRREIVDENSKLPVKGAKQKKDSEVGRKGKGERARANTYRKLPCHHHICRFTN